VIVEARKALISVIENGIALGLCMERPISPLADMQFVNKKEGGKSQRYRRENKFDLCQVLYTTIDG
jgi:hypothetical protein